MSLADPLVTAAVTPWSATSFSVVQRDGVGALRLDSGSGIALRIQHSDPSQIGVGKTERHYVQLVAPYNYTDPTTGLVRRLSATASLSVSFPAGTFTYGAALVDQLISVVSDSDFTSTKLLAFQS
jgi:hypothetical protein